MQVGSIETVVRALNDNKIRYLIVGGLAVNAHGYERMTRDLDLVISLEFENIVRALETLIAIGYQPSVPITPRQFADEELRNTWRKEKGMVVLKLWSDVHRRTPIDVFVHEPFDFDTEYSRARWENISSDQRAPIVSFEALIDLKRAAGRPQDLVDITELENIRKLGESSGS